MENKIEKLKEQIKLGTILEDGNYDKWVVVDDAYKGEVDMLRVTMLDPEGVTMIGVKGTSRIYSKDVLAKMMNNKTYSISRTRKRDNMYGIDRKLGLDRYMVRPSRGEFKPSPYLKEINEK